MSFQKPWKGDAPPALPNLMWDVYLGLIPCRRVGLDAQASTSSDLRDGCVIGMLAWKTQVPGIFASYLARFAPCPPMAPANLARDLAWWKKKGNRVLRSHLRWWHHTPQCHLVLPLPPLPLFTLPVLCLSQASQSGVQLHSRNKFVVWGRREWEGWGERGTKKNKKGKKEKKVIYCEALAENHFLNHCTILIRRPYCIQSREDLRGERGGRSPWSSPEDCKSRLCWGRQDVSGFSACPNLICTRITWPLLMYTVTRNDYFAISKSKALALVMAASDRGGAPGGENKARRLR